MNHVMRYENLVRVLHRLCDRTAADRTNVGDRGDNKKVPTLVKMTFWGETDGLRFAVISSPRSAGPPRC